MAKLRFAGFTLAGPKKLRFSGFTLAGTNTAPKLRFAGFSLVGSAPVRLQPIADQTVEAFESVTISVQPSPTSPTPTSYSWRQISGPTVTFSDNGSSITFVAPAAWAGTTVVFGVTGFVGSSGSSEVTATRPVIPHLYWNAVSGGWVPRSTPVKL